MYIYIHVLTYVRTYVCMRVCVYIYILVYILIFLFIMYLCIFMYNNNYSIHIPWHLFFLQLPEFQSAQLHRQALHRCAAQPLE